MKLTDQQKFQIAKASVEREFNLNFVLPCRSEQQKHVKYALTRVCCHICGIMPYDLSKIYKSINVQFVMNKRIVSGYSNKAWHIADHNLDFALKLNRCYQEVGEQLKNHNKNGVKAVALSSWGVTNQGPSDKGNLLLAQMIMSDKGFDLFSMGLNGEI